MVSKGEIVVLVLWNSGPDWMVKLTKPRVVDRESSPLGKMEQFRVDGKSQKWRCVDQKELHSVTDTTTKILNDEIKKKRSKLVSAKKPNLTEQEARRIRDEIIERFAIKPE